MLYSRTATNDVVLLRVDGHERDFRLLLQDAELVDVLGMDLDANNIEQVATATQGVSSFSINVIRSLAGQDTGRVDPVPVLTLTGEDDTAEGQMLMADFNNDGFDDFVVSTSRILRRLSENGRVEVRYGSASGLSSTSDVVYQGSVNGSQLGSGLTAGDFNNDGVSDLAIGSPGWASATTWRLATAVFRWSLATLPVWPARRGQLHWVKPVNLLKRADGASPNRNG